MKESVVMGDHPHDMEMAKRAGASATYLLTGHGKKHGHELTPDSQPDLIAGDIFEGCGLDHGPGLMTEQLRELFYEIKCGVRLQTK